MLARRRGLVAVNRPCAEPQRLISEPIWSPMLLTPSHFEGADLAEFLRLIVVIIGTRPSNKLGTEEVRTGRGR